MCAGRAMLAARAPQKLDSDLTDWSDNSRHGNSNNNGNSNGFGASGSGSRRRASAGQA